MNRKPLVLAAALIGALLIFSRSAAAAPANPVPQTYRQADGSAVVITHYGDEFFDWYEDETGFVVAYDEAGRNWRYGTVVYGAVQPTGQAVGSAALPVPPLYSAARLTRADLQGLIDASRDARAVPEADISARTAPEAPSAATAKTNQEIALFLVEFDNMPLMNDEQYWHGKYFAAEPGAKSVANYFKDMSGGLDIFGPADTVSAVAAGGTYRVNLIESGFAWADAGVDVTVYPSVADGIIRVKLHRDHPIKKWNNESFDEAAALLSVGVKAIKEQYPDFEIGEGRENLHIAAVIAGGEAATDFNPGGQVWAHAYSLDPSALGYHAPYMLHGEMHDETHAMAIGIAGHELGHSLGLPDLYDYTYMSAGVGPYSMMGNGNWGMAPGDEVQGQTPVAFDAWSKIRLGYIEPTEILSGADWRGDLRSAGSGYNVLKLTNSALSADQYFLAENRQPEGWDAGLWGAGVSEAEGNNGGVLVYHVDESAEDNSDAFHKLVDVEEADGDESLDNPYAYQVVGDDFFSWEKSPVFSETTVPDTNFHDGGPQSLASGIRMRVNSPRGPVMEVETGALTDILAAGISGLTAPAEGNTPITAGVLLPDEPELYSVTGLTWSPGDAEFTAGTVYAATVTLTADPARRFAGTITPTVNFVTQSGWVVSEGVTDGSGLGNALTFTVTFPPVGGDRDVSAAFADANFLKAVRKLLGNPDGPIYAGDLEQVENLNLSGNGIADLAGIEYFTSLQTLDCSDNQLTELDLSSNPELAHLHCGGNLLETLDTSGNPALITLYCADNLLVSMDVSNNPLLEELSCEHNYLPDTAAIIGLDEGRTALVFEPQHTLASYSVTVAPLANGSVAVSAEEAAAGETVTVTVTPDEGYRLAEGSLKVNGIAIVGDSFVMPAKDVTITAEFEAIAVPRSIDIDISAADQTTLGDHRTITIDGLTVGDFVLIQYEPTGDSDSNYTAKSVTFALAEPLVEEIYYRIPCIIHVTVFNGVPNYSPEATSLGVDMVRYVNSRAADGLE
ncbi:MAG: M6 family metalloprotease domain-containing protein [Oscillospiraceae bacterium]|jgi:M6 family metalloprotease-like protein|nr:M6 family metalloprotease domain-containing protein [Oscillospiraceae bacterium]